MSALTAIRAITLGAAISFAGAVAATAAAAPARMDFVAQYAAASLVASGQGGSVLDPDAVLAAERAAAPERQRLLPFVQPPAVALLLTPLASVPFGVAFVLMAIVDAAILAVAVAVLRRGAGDGRSMAAALMLIAPPSAMALAHAQLSPLALLLVALAVRGGPRAGGVALGLTLLRPQNAPLLLVAALIDPARRWWAIAGSTLVLLASAAVVGPAGLARYAGELIDASGWSITGEEGLRTSVGWSGLALWLGLGPIGLMAAAVSLAVGTFVLIRTRPDERVTVAAAWSLLASPHALMHDAVLAYPAVLAFAARRAPWDVASAVAWIAHVLIAPVGALWSLALAVRALRYRIETDRDL